MNIWACDVYIRIVVERRGDCVLVGSERLDGAGEDLMRLSLSEAHALARLLAVAATPGEDWRRPPLDAAKENGK